MHSGFCRWLAVPASMDVEAEETEDFAAPKNFCSSSAMLNMYNAMQTAAKVECVRASKGHVKYRLKSQCARIPERA